MNLYQKIKAYNRLKRWRNIREHEKFLKGLMVIGIFLFSGLKGIIEHEHKNN